MYPGPASCILNMQPKTQLSSAFFIPDELRNEILQRNEIANLMDLNPIPGKKTHIYLKKNITKLISHYLLTLHRSTGRNRKQLPLTISPRDAPPASQIAVPIVHVSSHQQ